MADSRTCLILAGSNGTIDCQNLLGRRAFFKASGPSKAFSLDIHPEQATWRHEHPPEQGINSCSFIQFRTVLSRTSTRTSDCSQIILNSSGSFFLGRRFGQLPTAFRSGVVNRYR